MGGFLSPPHLPLALARDPSTPHSVQPASFLGDSPPLQDPGEVPLPSSSEPLRETLEEGEQGVRSAPHQPLSLFMQRLGKATELVPATGEVCPLLWGQTTGSHCWAAARPGGRCSQPPSSSLSGPQDPSPTPDPSTRQGLFQAGEVILSTRPTRCKEVSHPHGRSLVPPSLLSKPSPWAPQFFPLHSLLEALRSGPPTPVGGTKLGGQSGKKR